MTTWQAIYEVLTDDAVFGCGACGCFFVTVPLVVILFNVVQDRTHPDLPFTTHRCSRCGYDLRETPNRCPECGHQPPR